uniref:Disease resistance R13L4/SHOC-2-like LRR domain-containing protein n=1 Tax=Tetraselmis chuii TaxID=63592 RepID=A0A7S1SKA5_9CHLO
MSVLDVRKNRLRALPLELCSMQLSLLDLTDNELPSLPPQLGLMTSLRKLPLDGNPLKSIRREVLAGPTPRLLSWLRDKIPDDMGSMGAQRGDQVHTGNVFGGDSSTLAADAAEKMKLGGSQRQELSFPGSGLTHIPPEVWEAGEAGLQSLDVTGNKLSSIDPQDLSRCRELVTLQAGRNALQVWPLPLGASSLPSLVRLCVSFNPIRSAPPGAFASCAATLRVLDLSGVPAAGCLPSGCLSSLRQLEELLMSQASISSFPMEIIDNEPLPALRVLKLSGNQMTDLPQGVTALVRLEELDVSNNDLTNVPPHIGLMTNLRSLQLDGNRLRSIRRPVLERGTKALLEYLRDRIPA